VAKPFRYSDNGSTLSAVNFRSLRRPATRNSPAAYPPKHSFRHAKLLRVNEVFCENDDAYHLQTDA
jgi:hypothetical protein